MNRRKFVLAGSFAVALPRAIRAQGRTTVIGLLVPNALQFQPGYPILVESLRSLGYREGENMRLLVREANNDLGRLPALALELVAAGVDAIVAYNTPGAQAAIGATRTIPIVMTQVGDPVGSGFVASLARPGGNVTGVSNLAAGVASKRLALLREIVPSAKRIAVLYNPADPITAQQSRDVEGAAGTMGVAVRLFPVRSAAELRGMHAQLLEWKANAAFWLLGAHQMLQAESIRLAREQRLPLMVGNSGDVQAGGLISYSTDGLEIARRTAMQVDRILKGAKPGDIPVEQPTTFELAVNLKTAKALGIRIPRSIILRADRVVE